MFTPSSWWLTPIFLSWCNFNFWLICYHLPVSSFFQTRIFIIAILIYSSSWDLLFVEGLQFLVTFLVDFLNALRLSLWIKIIHHAFYILLAVSYIAFICFWVGWKFCNIVYNLGIAAVWNEPLYMPIILGIRVFYNQVSANYFLEYRSFVTKSEPGTSNP